LSLVLCIASHFTQRNNAVEKEPKLRGKGPMTKDRGPKANDPRLRFHLAGDWDESQVPTVWSVSSHVMPAEARELIDHAWRTASARPGVKLFDGPMCRLEHWSPSRGLLQLTLSRTSYKLFLGTNMCHPELADRFGPQVLANPVGVSPALETADGFLMLGRRNARVAYYPGRIHPFAGCLEPVEGQPGESSSTEHKGPDVFAAVRRELWEELGLGVDDVPVIRCTGIAEDVCLRQPELIFRVKCALTRSQIEFQVARDEHHDSWSVPATSTGVEAGLADPALTPVAVASLLLWGRIAFGPKWFEASSTRANARSM
jgi:8-oxo-dGTP pyrophosphatase MutT (NUDIX family)